MLTTYKNIHNQVYGVGLFWLVPSSSLSLFISPAWCKLTVVCFLRLIQHFTFSESMFPKKLRLMRARKTSFGRILDELSWAFSAFSGWHFRWNHWWNFPHSFTDVLMTRPGPFPPISSCACPTGMRSQPSAAFWLQRSWAKKTDLIKQFFHTNSDTKCELRKSWSQTFPENSGVLYKGKTEREAAKHFFRFLFKHGLLPRKPGRSEGYQNPSQDLLRMVTGGLRFFFEFELMGLTTIASGSF